MITYTSGLENILCTVPCQNGKNYLCFGGTCLILFLGSQEERSKFLQMSIFLPL